MKPLSRKKILLLIVLAAIGLIEVGVRASAGRGSRFYLLRDVTFKLEEASGFNPAVDVLCLGGSASYGTGLADPQSRYSEVLNGFFPELRIANKSSVGAPLSEVIYYLHRALAKNSIRYCVIFSGNNEYLELLNRGQWKGTFGFAMRYALPKIFSLVSDCSYGLHNCCNRMMEMLKLTEPRRYAIMHGPTKEQWPPLNRTAVAVQKAVFRLRVYELKSLIRAHPGVTFIYVIPPVNYPYVWGLMRAEREAASELPEDSALVRREIEHSWIRHRYLITPDMQDMIKQGLRGVSNARCIDLDTLFRKQSGSLSGTSRFFLDYCHLNAAGHRILAEELKKVMESK